MIVVSTDYDRLTTILAEFAAELESYDAEVRVLKKANSLELENLLSSLTTSIIFFGHGRIDPPRLLDQDQAALWDNKIAALLEQRVLYGNACHSLEALAGFGLARIGFSGKLEVHDDQGYYAAQRECILAGPRALLSGKTAAEAAEQSKQAFLSKQRELFHGSFGDSVIATLIFKPNADRIAFTGDGSARARNGGNGAPK